MIRRWQQFTTREKLIFLTLFAVLLPTVVLFVAQYNALSDLREKSKAAFEYNLRQMILEIEGRTHDQLLGQAGTILQDFPESSLEPWNSAQIKENLTRILELNEGVETVFVFTGDLKGSSLALVDANGFRENTGGTNPEEIFKKIGEEDFVLPLVAAAQSPLEQNARNNLWTVQKRCENCGPGDRSESFYLYRKLLTNNKTVLSLVGVRLKQNYLVENFLKPAIVSSAQTAGEKQETEFTLAVFDGQKKLLFANSDQSRTPDSFEIQSPLPRVFPLWTIAASYRQNNIEELSNSYFWRGIFLMLLVFGLLVLGVLLIFRVTSREVGLAQAKSAFVSNVSHELKTPLSLIRLFAETLESGRVKNQEKAQEYYRIITNETNRLTQLINNILDFSAIEAGRKDYKFSEQELCEVVAEVMQNYSYGLESAGFEVETDFEENLPKVLIDRDAISQAVLNLLNNAVKYSADEKYVKISVKRLGNSAAVSVTDHGIGIAPEEQDRIFEKFYRSGGSSDVHNVKGSGLGLALVQHIVEAHSGRITVNSALQRGSTFTIILPVGKSGEY